jgi:4-amino-4-deoxychorismate lyase
MYQLVETIKIINGHPQNLAWHQKRFEHSYESQYYQSSKIELEKILVPPEQYSKGKIKARFLYSKEFYSVEFQEYIPVKVQSLKIIENDSIEYAHKYIDRSAIVSMMQERGICDDILIVKKGRITDSSISNIVFYDGEKWITPEFPLLKGTTRERLLHGKRIFLRDITIGKLKLFSHFRLINSMLDFEEQEMLGISNIK